MITYIEKPRCNTIPSSQLFKGIWLIFLYRDNQYHVKHPTTLMQQYINCGKLKKNVPFQSQSEVRIDLQHHNLQPADKYM